MEIVSVAKTHPGLVREHNEDAVLAREYSGLWLVADGVGGYGGGDIASSMLVDALEEISLTGDLADRVTQVEEAILAANDKVIGHGHETGSAIGSTVLAFVFHKQHGAVLWAGDSRLYRCRGGGIEQITVDHTVAQHYVDEGIINATEAETHPDKDSITRALGLSDPLHLEIEILGLAIGDRLLLCSDGLYKHVDAQEMQTLINSNRSIDDIVTELMDLTLARGATDNVSLAVLDFEEDTTTRP